MLRASPSFAASRFLNLLIKRVPDFLFQGESNCGGRSLPIGHCQLLDENNKPPVFPPSGLVEADYSSTSLFSKVCLHSGLQVLCFFLENTTSGC